MQNLLIYVKKFFSNFLKLDFKYLKNKGIYVLTAVVSVFLMVYIAFQIKLSAVDNTVCIQVAEKNKVSVYTDLSGYMFMDEESIVYSEKGYLWVPDPKYLGKYVDDGITLGNVYNTSDREAVEKIKEIDEKIAILKKCMVVNEGILGSKEYDKDVKNSYSTVLESIRTGNLFALRQNTESWLLTQGKKNIAISYVTSYNPEIKALENEKAMIISSLGEGTEIKASNNGRYFGYTDGYEEYFLYNIAKSGNYDEIHELLSKVGSASVENRKGSPCGKLVYSSKWYFVAAVTKEDLKDLDVGKTYSAAFEENNSKVMSLKYERTLLGSKGNGYAVFSCNDMPEDFEHVRFQNIRLKTAEYEGICIGSSSVRYNDGDLGVYVAKSDKMYFRKIRIITEYGGMYVVKPLDDFTTEEKAAIGDDEIYLSNYETVIVSGKDLWEGKYIDMSELKD